MTYEELLDLGDRLGKVSKGLTPEEIQKIPIVKCVKVIDDKGERKTCAICYEEFSLGVSIKRLGCKHDYHILCIDPWLANECRCPVCNKAVVANDE